MGLDIRIPIGLLFEVVGLILTGRGLFGSGEIYAKSLGMNVNLWWGIVLLCFGTAMLAFGLRAGRSKAEADHDKR